MNLLGLLGLLALPVIFVLHLLRERQERRTVSGLELWAWLKPEVRGPRPRRAPWTRILALQLLAALCLTAALVNPQLPLPLPPLQAARLILIVDTSSSMSAADVLPSRLAAAQARAAARLAALGEDDSAALITAGTRAARVADSAQTGLPALASALAGLRAAGVGHDWGGALALASASVVPGQDNRIVIFTDGAFEFPASLNALPAPVEWNLVGAPQPNQAIVALAARPAPSGAVQVFTRVANFGAAPAQRLLTLLADGETMDSSLLALPAAGTLSLVWTLPPGARTVEARLSGADALPADDRAGLGLSNPPVDALLVSPAAVESANRCARSESGRTPIERALCAVPNLLLKTLHPETYVAYEPHDLYVFQGWLPQAWPHGGALVLDPPLDSALLPTGDSPPITGTLVTDPLLTDSLLADVSFAQVTFGRPARLLAPEWLTPLYAREGAGLIWRGAHASTRLVVLAFNTGDGNLTRRSAFPILVANAVRELLPPALPESVRPGEAMALPSAQVFPGLTLTDPLGGARSFGADRPALFSDTARTGLYTLQGLTPDGQPKIFGFGVNAGSPAESDLQRQAAPAFSLSPAPAAAPSAARLPLADLWPVFVIAALALLIVEARYAWR
jgi:hypothetical protein